MIHLFAPTAVMDGLRPSGWHNGTDLDGETGYAMELTELYQAALPLPDRLSRLREIISTLRAQAARFDAVPVVWHPGFSGEDVGAVTDALVVTISVATPRAAAEQWDQVRRAWNVAPPGGALDAVCRLLRRSGFSQRRANGTSRRMIVSGGLRHPVRLSIRITWTEAT